MSKESALKFATSNPASVPNPTLAMPGSTPPPASPAETTAPVEAAAAPAAEAKTEDKGLSLIIKREQELFKQREELKKQREEILAKEDRYNKVMERVNAFEETAKKDKIAALKMIGWSDTDIINAMNGETPAADPVAEARRVAQEIASQEIEKRFADRDTKANEQSLNTQVKEIQDEVRLLLKNDAAKFKHSAFEGEDAYRQALAIIAVDIEQNPDRPVRERISVKEALEITEELYKDKHENARKLFEEAAAAETPAPAPAAEIARGSMAGRPPVSNVPTPKPRTMSNAVSATAQALTPSANRETPAQKRERLIQQIREGGLRKS